MSGRIIIGESPDAVPDDPVQLVVTSPPYNVGKGYDLHDDELPFAEWQSMLARTLRKCWDRLDRGGRMCVNIIHENGRSPAVALGMHTQQILEGLPYSLNRGTIIWDKGASTAPSTAWGSWMSAANPTLRGSYEMIYVYSKRELGRPEPITKQSDISRDQFLKATLDVWSDIGAVPNEIKRAGGQVVGTHPAPFPVKLATRLIQLYSFPGDTVIDPFFGSGTVGLAAEELGRDWVGVEMSEEYARMAAARIAPFEGMEPRVEIA